MKDALAIITVVYNNYDVTEDFLLSLKKQENQDFHLFLTDLSDHKQATPLLHPDDVKITTLRAINKGYAYGINLGLKHAINKGYQYFCVINNDTYFKESFVESVLSSILQHPSSLIGSKIYYAPGYEFHKTRYQKSDLGRIIWYAGGKIDWNNLVTPHLGIDEVDKGQYNKLEKTSFITGCLMVFDKKIIEKAGFFDESYFLYYEDADYCIRVKRKGIKLFYDPKIIIWHKNAQSTEGSGSNIHQKFQEKNRLKFGLKYAPLRTKLHLLKNLFYKSLGF